jgi:hypothetical protein
MEKEQKIEKVVFTEAAVQDYLDTAIRTWRAKRKEAAGDERRDLIAACYVDAFQSVRSSIFGSTLPPGE